MHEHLANYLTCDVELNFAGPTRAVLNKWAADVLRALADRLEKHEFDDGYHEVKDRVGKPVGTIYVDYSESD
ncbi:hypothetical protein ASG42_03800 [Rhizobium sp. Leaf391]|nr:hypothetical protein ASG50_28390 [Rhizobium sp. Leaf386]KQS99985.1 hypothetical protein ASG42_03800 [Rhizobium sp. Leaf391]